MSTRRKRVGDQAHPLNRRAGPPIPIFAGAAAVLLTVVAVVTLSSALGGSPSATLSPLSSPHLGISPASSGLAGTGPAATPNAPVSPSDLPSSSAPPPAAGGQVGRFGLGLLIADRGNGRLLIVNDAKRILWRFPAQGSLPPGQKFEADDAFLAPDGRTIVANDEFHEVIDRIDIVTRKVIWQYGHYGQPGSATGYLHTPDDAYPMANGNVTVADIRNCRILEIDPAKRIVHQWGKTRSCGHHPPQTYNNPNGDTPLPDGGVLITEIGGSRVVRLDAQGRVVFDIHVPVAYPSDAQLDPSGNVIVVDYTTGGSILRVSPSGKVLWRYKPRTASAGLDHASLAVPLPDGTIVVNDDFHHRVIVIDPATNRIVWQYGHTGTPGTAAGYLNTPDGVNAIPLGTTLH